MDVNEAMKVADYYGKGNRGIVDKYSILASSLDVPGTKESSPDILRDFAGDEVADSIGRLEGMKDRQALVDNSLDFVGGKFIKGPARTLSNEDALRRWGKDADATLRGRDNIPETMYHGSENAKQSVFDVPSGNKPRHAYQREGYVFTSGDPGFAAEYSGKTYMGAPKNASKEDIDFINSMSELAQGEGNMMGLMHRNKKVFNPSDPEHYDEYMKHFKKEPDSRDITNPEIGWKASERQEMLDFLKEKGYDGQWVNENGVRNFMTNSPKNTRNIFDPLDKDDPYTFFENISRLAAGVSGGRVLDPNNKKKDKK